MSGGLQRYCVYVEIVRKAKAHLELSMATYMNTSVEGFHKDNSSKRKTRENMAPLLKRAGRPLAKDTEVLNVSFTFLIVELALSNLREPRENTRQCTFSTSGGWSGQGIYIGNLYLQNPWPLCNGPTSAGDTGLGHYRLLTAKRVWRREL